MATPPLLARSLSKRERPQYQSPQLGHYAEQDNEGSNSNQFCTDWVRDTAARREVAGEGDIPPRKRQKGFWSAMMGAVVEIGAIGYERLNGLPRDRDWYGVDSHLHQP